MNLEQQETPGIMRSRTTWQNKGTETPRTAATLRTADPYTMNQDHPDPSPTEYAIPGHDTPADWAEERSSYDTIAEEYDGDHVKRNEIGFGEFRGDTWKHKDSDKWNGKGKYDNKTAAERKAMAAQKLSTLILRSNNPDAVRTVATGLMSLPDAVMAQTVKLAAASSPEALPEAARFKRAVACTKLAARLLGDGSDEPTVERLARSIYRIDDPTLKSIVKIVASARVAQETEEEDKAKDGQTAQVEVQAQTPVQAQAQAEEPAEVPEAETAGDEPEAEGEPDGDEGMTPEETAMAQEMLSGAGDDLAALFTMAPPVPAMPGAPGAPGMAPEAPLPMAAPMAPCAPAMASSSPAITFGDDEEVQTASDGTSIDDIFGDDPEVQAQREIVAAQREQTARTQVGFGNRTASTTPKGAKKLGAVTRTAAAAPQVDQLENLWR